VVVQLCAEAERVLAPGGVFLELSCSADLMPLLCRDRRWAVTAHPVRLPLPAAFVPRGETALRTFTLYECRVAP
jgi:hypothetical protein